MMPTMTSRKTYRKGLATLLGTDPTLVAVFDHESANPGGQSPFATVHSDRTRTQFPDYTRQRHRFWLTLYWKRGQAGDTEDRLDDLSAAVRQLLIDNTDLSGSGLWHDLEFDEEDQGGEGGMDCVLIDGVAYRRERIPVTVFVISY
jgi:hypothetical protein